MTSLSEDEGDSKAAAMQFLTSISLGSTPAPPANRIPSPSTPGRTTRSAHLQPAAPRALRLTAAPASSPSLSPASRASPSESPLTTDTPMAEQARDFLTNISLGVPTPAVSPDSARFSASGSATAGPTASPTHAALLSPTQDASPVDGEPESSTATNTTAVVERPLHLVVASASEPAMNRPRTASGQGPLRATAGPLLASPKRALASSAASLGLQLPPPLAAFRGRGVHAIERFVDQDAKLQRHSRLFLVSSEASTPLATVSYKLDKTLAHRAEGGSAQAAAGSSAASHGISSLDLGVSEISTASSEDGRHIAFLPLAACESRVPTSFASLIHPTWIPVIGDDRERPLFYAPSLDDPVLKTGKHRTVMTLPGFKCSIVPFIRPNVLRDELNEQFRQQHREVHDAGVTLSKLRKAKAKILSIVNSSNHEVSSAAICFCLIDRLLRTGKVDKPSFKIVSAVCFYLAVKFNEPVTPEFLRRLREQLSKVLDISINAIIEHEFHVFAKLGLSLFLDPDEVLPYYHHIQGDMAIAVVLDGSSSGTEVKQ